MRIIKQNRTGRRILALLLSSCLLAGFVPAAYASPADTDEGGESGLFLDKWVEETGDGNFKLVLESYATGSNDTVTTEPVPVDIVLVLDESGSMDDVLVQGCDNKNGTDVEVTTEGHLAEDAELDESPTEGRLLFVGHKVFFDDVDTRKTYTVVYPADGTTRNIYYCTACKGWFSNTNHADHQNIAEWIPFKNEDGTPKETHTSDEWTCNVQFYERCGQTGRDLLQEALGSFLETLYEASNPDGEEPIDNRVAIVGYGQGASYIYLNGDRLLVYNDPGDGPGGLPVNGAAISAAGAWCNVANLDEDSIDDWVNGICAVGSTPTHLGIQAAELAFENAPATEDKERTKVMILFTDGAPGANYNNYGPGQNQYPDWVTPGITSAKAMKDDGVTIYSVGLFPDANGYNAQDISYDGGANGNGSPADGFFDNANCFLHLVSSNYPYATGVDEEARGDLSDKYVEDAKSYYLGTSDATQLAGIFEQISQEVTPGSATVKLDGSAIVKDKITDDFRITDTDGLADVTAYTMSYNGEGKEWTKDEDSVSTVDDTDTEGKLHITVDGQNVSVTNFDFAANFVHMDENGNPEGKKLVVEILIKPTDATSGGIKLPTNVMNETHTDNAGIYGPDTNTPVAEFPLPYVDLPTTVTVKKVVDGIESTEKFSFDAAYIQAGDYEDIDSEVANDSNYLYLKEGTRKTPEFELANGDTYKLENVKVGTSLTISEKAANGWTPTVRTDPGTEALVPDADGEYTVTVTPGMVITFINTKEHDESDKPGTIHISVGKIWDDADDQEGKRPDSITIRLYADGKLKDTATVTAEDGWKWTFANLPKDDNGKDIVYTITEDKIPGYDSVITGNVSTGFTITNSHISDPGEPDKPDPDTPDPDEPDPAPDPAPEPTPEPAPEPDPDIPVEPETPDEPSEPVTPGEPEAPSDPGVPETSDRSMTGLWLALCLLALGVLGLLKFTQPRQRRRTRR